MADVSSRAFKDGKFFKASSNLVSFFNSHFPLPKNLSWKEHTLHTDISSRIIACLRGRLLPLAQLQRLPATGKNTGEHGNNMPQNAEWTPTWSHAQPNSKKPSYVPLLHGSGRVQLEGGVRSVFKESLTPWQPSPRPSNWLENVVPSTEEMKSIK